MVGGKDAQNYIGVKLTHSYIQMKSNIEGVSDVMFSSLQTSRTCKTEVSEDRTADLEYDMELIEERYNDMWYVIGVFKNSCRLCFGIV